MAHFVFTILPLNNGPTTSPWPCIAFQEHGLREQSRWDQRRRRRTSRWKEGQNKTKLDIRSKEDEGGIQVDKQQDKVTDAAGLGGPIFGAGKDDKKQDLGVTGTG
ncbi:hypothetical protein Bca4012_038989 [Brassica carinata]